MRAVHCIQRDGPYCSRFRKDGEIGNGKDLATVVYYRHVEEDDPCEWTLNLAGKSIRVKKLFIHIVMTLIWAFSDIHFFDRTHHYVGSSRVCTRRQSRESNSTRCRGFGKLKRDIHM